MAYVALDNSTVLDYLRTVPALDGILPQDAGLHAREVGDGNLNQVFIVQSGNADGRAQRLSCPQAGAPVPTRGRRVVAAYARADAL